MGFLKNILWIGLIVGVGYAMYLFLPVVMTRSQISQEARDKLEFVSRSMRGRKLTQEVISKLQTISVPGVLNEESVQASTNSGRLNLSFDYEQHIIVKLPNGQEKIIARFRHHISIDDLVLRGN